MGASDSKAVGQCQSLDLENRRLYRADLKWYPKETKVEINEFRCHLSRNSEGRYRVRIEIPSLDFDWESAGHKIEAIFPGGVKTRDSWEWSYNDFRCGVVLRYLNRTEVLIKLFKITNYLRNLVYLEDLVLPPVTGCEASHFRIEPLIYQRYLEDLKLHPDGLSPSWSRVEINGIECLITRDRLGSYAGRLTVLGQPSAQVRDLISPGFLSERWFYRYDRAIDYSPALRSSDTEFTSYRDMLLDLIRITDQLQLEMSDNI